MLRGSVYERLKWTFKLYDLNGDGCISRGELAEVVQAVHELMGRKIADDDRKTRDQVNVVWYNHFIKVCFNESLLCFKQVDRVFKKLDLNQDGVITIEEFLEACLKDELITKSLEMFDKGLWWQTNDENHNTTTSIAALPVAVYLNGSTNNNNNNNIFKPEINTLINF